ncbi:hypothetical protein PENARI_c006G09601 [Penicillium arizonense]|uniref:Cell wall protein n=1 Tax=Penicillium arizonense TaxID=1835702 RepID=A0A1F5LN17_PENAI|nr:hypothetical protein PENARI_c006G09601 [Penicillium arizonense]OGE54311.1 hypothetical protein PENARI_c006G09601 [Penicillium arizonense]
MRSSLVLLAGLAGSALAYPTDMAVERRTFGLLAEILGGVSDITVDVTSILGAVLGGGHHSHSSSLLAGLGAEGAAALQGGALGCKAGVIHAEARAALKIWLHLHADLEASLKTSLISWCEGDDELVLSADVLAALAVYIPSCADIAAKGQLYVTIDGIFGASSLESALVLSASLQSSLSAWIEAAVGLDVDVKAGLYACAAGGVVTSLTADVKASLLAWINGSNCDLSAELKVSVLAWINGHHGHGLVEIGALGEAALSTISVGASVGVHVEESGILSVGGQASLAAFLGADVSADLSADVQLALEACAKGKLATAVDLDIRTKLAIWLSGSDCSLGVELKAVVLFWLSFGVDASVSIDLVGGVLTDVTGLLTELLSSLSVDLRAALSVILSGGSLEAISLSARAELAAFLGGCTGLEIDVNIQLIIIEWFTGCSIPGAPSGIKSSSVPSLPSSTPYVSSTGVPSGPGASVSVSIPSGPAPSGSAPSGVSPTGSVPSGPGASVSVSVPAGPAPSGSSPSGPETTPCDTLTGVDVSSTVIPGGSSPSGSVPSGPAPSGSSPSGPAPSGSVPSGPAPSGSSPSGSSPSGPETTPCDTLTGVDVSSTVIPGMPAPSGGASGPAPSGPAPTGGASGPSPSGVSPTGTPVAPGAGETTTPCDTLTSEEISSTVIPGAPAPSGGASGPAPSNTDVSPTGTPVPSGPAASGPAPSGGASGPSPSGVSPTGTPVAPGAGETTTPCDTLTSEEISSTVIPGAPAPSGGASGPAPSNSDVSPTGTAVVPSGPAATGGSWTESWAYTQTKETTISATVPCETGSGSVPTITAPAVASSVTTVTATVTATVCGCDE